uniref:Uncharacterized protein n=1 Tax=Oryza glumipatula TaxID=40148 RepID=A0A0E0A9F9_9ORYZ
MEPLAAAFPSGSPSCSRCFPLKLAGPAAAATAVRSQWLPSSSSHQASGDCRRLLASSMSTAAAISSPSPSHADLVLQDLCRIEHPQARGNQKAWSYFWKHKRKDQICTLLPFPANTYTPLGCTYPFCLALHGASVKQKVYGNGTFLREGIYEFNLKIGKQYIYIHRILYEFNIKVIYSHILSYHNINNVGPYFWWVLHAVIIIKAMKGSRLPAAWQLLFRISLPINCYCLCGICMLFITVYGMLFMKQRAGC